MTCTLGEGPQPPHWSTHPSQQQPPGASASPYLGARSPSPCPLRLGCLRLQWTNQQMVDPRAAYLEGWPGQRGDPRARVVSREGAVCPLSCIACTIGGPCVGSASSRSSCVPVQALTPSWNRLQLTPGPPASTDSPLPGRPPPPLMPFPSPSPLLPQSLLWAPEDVLPASGTVSEDAS